MYGKYYETYPMSLNQRSLDEVEEVSDLNTAIQAYLDKDFELSSGLFDNLYRSNGQEVYLLYAANAYQANGDCKSAVERYERLIVNNNKNFVEQAQWYQALCFYKEQMPDLTIRLLENFRESHYKYEEAQKLLKKIK